VLSRNLVSRVTNPPVKNTESSVDGYKSELASKFLATGYFIYAAAIILFLIGWLAAIGTRLSQVHAGLPSVSVIPTLAFLVAATLFAILNIIIGRQLLKNDRTRYTWVLVLVSLLEIPIGTGLAFLTLLWLWSLRESK
jgi:hypothetical protein